MYESPSPPRWPQWAPGRSRFVEWKGALINGVRRMSMLTPIPPAWRLGFVGGYARSLQKLLGAGHHIAGAKRLSTRSATASK